MLSVCVKTICMISAIGLSSAVLSQTRNEKESDAGIISFSGEIVNRTCLINGQPASGDFVVQLPSVESARLKQAGQRYGDTEFRIQLSGCGQPGRGVRVRFDVPGQGGKKRFAVTPHDPDDSMAENVQVELEDQAAADADDMVFYPIDDDGHAEIAYTARYFASSPVKAGKVHSRVTYVLEYL